MGRNSVEATNASLIFAARALRADFLPLAVGRAVFVPFFLEAAVLLLLVAALLSLVEESAVSFESALAFLDLLEVRDELSESSDLSPYAGITVMEKAISNDSRAAKALTGREAEVCTQATFIVSL